MTKKRVNKVVLAYSGGLDTSVILKWIKETYGCEVITVTADVGQGEDLSGIEAKALATGASKAYVLDLKEEFLTQYAFPVLRSGAVYERKYLLGTSFARPLIAKYQVEIAKREGADAVAHGCTGKGNDQVRFELTYKALAPELTVIAPWREWDLSGREALLEYAASRGIPVAQSKENIYSRDQNLWHLSHEGGELEDPWQAPSERVYQITASPQAAPDQPEEIVIGFEHGYPVSLNGERLPPVTLMERLNAIGGQHGIGRIDLVENRLVGMKSRGVYEQPGATILSVAHKELEHLTLDRETMHFKDQLALKYAELVYYGLWYTPLREALDAFVDVTQRTVTGEVRLMLYKGNCIPTGRRSPYSLYSMELATFGADAIYDQRDAEGFINIFGLPLEVAALLAKQRSASS
ncbi:argininosuccinate synthase [Thermomicrobium sp.]|uniref:argininosuccinate synthase n=1 Tax=Thermomicrobium sp. TaxID=1969469 RepID=UPI001B297A9B|nr:argininosuccinate synthase [Thermomicrobium sp.]MBO9305884.1 argininosuccinate synthase [Thermomicrobium sp.]